MLSEHWWAVQVRRAEAMAVAIFHKAAAALPDRLTTSDQ